LARISENLRAPPSFRVLAVHNGWEDDDSADDPIMSDENKLINYGPVT